MNPRRLLFLSLCLLVALITVPAAAGSDLVALLQLQSGSRDIAGEPLRNRAQLRRFYQERGFAPAWSNGQSLTAAAEELLAILPDSAAEGLDPSDYHLPALAAHLIQFRSHPDPMNAAAIDLLLSDACLLLAGHFCNGRNDPALVDPDWHIRRESFDAVRFCQQVLVGNRLRDDLHALLPNDPTYAALRRAYLEQRRIAAAGGWPRLFLTPPLRPGTTAPAVAVLRQRLTISGDLVGGPGEGPFFDAELEAAVRRFQQRHGLTVDGVIGPATLAALNVSAEQRARQLALNLERWRWLPRRNDNRFLRINLPAFRLELIESQARTLEMRVIVGRQVRQTPVFAGRMTYLVLNPYWEVPRKLAVEDLLPKFQADPDYLRTHDFNVFTGDRRPVDPATIDWRQFDAGNFPFQLRQNPGPKNSLGRVKFIFPNAYSIYLHDTPSRRLFDREQRSFSSGCIRIEKPLELAQRLLHSSPLAEPTALEEALRTAVNRTVLLPTPLPVYLVYFTAWVEADGSLRFLPDLYLRDPRLDAALRQRLP